MASLNKVMLIGNLTRDPEVRYTPKGQAVTDVGLAMNRRYMVDNEWREEVTFRRRHILGEAGRDDRPILQEGPPVVRRGAPPTR